MNDEPCTCYHVHVCHRSIFRLRYIFTDLKVTNIINCVLHIYFIFKDAVKFTFFNRQKTMCMLNLDNYIVNKLQNYTICNILQQFCLIGFTEVFSRALIQSITSCCCYARPAKSCPKQLLGPPISVHSGNGKCTTKMCDSIGKPRIVGWLFRFKRPFKRVFQPISGPSPRVRERLEKNVPTAPTFTGIKRQLQMNYIFYQFYSKL